MSSQRLDVGEPFAERRNEQRDAVETVEQILTKQACRNALLQVTIGRGDDANGDRTRAGRPNAEHFLGFEDAQQLDLSREWHVSDFVQEHAPATGRDSSNPIFSPAAPVKAPRS